MERRAKKKVNKAGHTTPQKGLAAVVKRKLRTEGAQRWGGDVSVGKRKMNQHVGERGETGPRFANLLGD